MEIALCLAALGWAFVGSLLLGLGTRPTAPVTAWAWLAGEVLIGALAVLRALAGHGRQDGSA